jgi:hypothetical protein
VENKAVKAGPNPTDYKQNKFRLINQQKEKGGFSPLLEQSMRGKKDEEKECAGKCTQTTKSKEESKSNRGSKLICNWPLVVG